MPLDDFVSPYKRRVTIRTPRFCFNKYLRCEKLFHEVLCSWSLVARVLSPPVFSTKSRGTTGLAEDFQERRGVNVKTNDSGCKECGSEEERERRAGEGKGEGRRRTSTDGAVTRMAAATRTMTIPFYFPHSLVSRSLRLSTFISPVVLAISSIFRVHPLSLFRRLLPNTVHRCTAGVLKCIPRSGDPSLLFRIPLSDFSSLRAGPRPYLFTVIWAP